MERRWKLRLKSRELVVGPRPVVMGIVNVTPDSFSDGGRFLKADAAIAQGVRLATEGAEIIDVGGESTRPGAAPVRADEEISRVIPVIRGLRGQTEAAISIDSRKAAVAEAALAAGAELINDISALGEAEMAHLAARAGCPVILMHMQGTPATMQAAPHYVDVASEVRDWLREALERARRAGVDVEQTVVDPGIGFGKTVAHNLELLARLDELQALGRPIMVGTSRKSFIGKVLDAESDRRLVGSVATCVYARMRGADLFRVHDVAETVEALRMVSAIEEARKGR